MRITFVNRYYWPESVLVNDIAGWMAAAGHDVRVITGQPDYNPEANLPAQPRREIRDGVEIRRITLFRDKGRGLARNLNSLFFIFQAFVHVLFGKRPDAVWSTSIPPVLQPLLLRIASRLRGARFLYFLQDIYPEIAVTSNLMKKGFVQDALVAVDNWTLNNADAVVTLSEDMADVITSRGSKPKALFVVRSFSPSKRPRPGMDRRREGPVRFLFAGNLGRFQNLDALVDAFARIDPAEATLTFLGDGREKARLVSRVGTERLEGINFRDFVPAEEASQLAEGFDAGIVSLSPNIYRYAYPAKTYMYLGAGLPMLLLVEPESELSQIVEKRGIGKAVAPLASVDEMLAAIRAIIAGLGALRANVYANTDDLYLPERARSQWLAIFTGMAGGKDV